MYLNFEQNKIDFQLSLQYKEIMKAFITGGTGFIGSHLVDRLLSENIFTEIRCLVRSNEKWLQGKKYKKVVGDLNDLTALTKGIDGVDVIFHLAAIVKAKTEKEFIQANVESTENLIRIAQKKGVKNIVVLSSLAAVGSSDGIPVTEETEFSPVSNYGKSKKAMELMIHDLATKKDSIKIIRPPAVYGPREDQIYTFFKTFKSGICPIVGDGNQPRLSMVYVDDLVKGIILAANKTEQGIHTYFISGEQQDYSWNEIIGITTKVMGKKPFRIKLKPALVKKLASLIESASSLFGIYPVVNNEKANEMVLEWICSDQKAQNDLHYKAETTLEEGLSRTIHWYKKHNWL